MHFEIKNTHKNPLHLWTSYIKVHIHSYKLHTHRHSL